MLYYGTNFVSSGGVDDDMSVSDPIGTNISMGTYLQYFPITPTEKPQRNYKVARVFDPNQRLVPLNCNRRIQ